MLLRCSVPVLLTWAALAAAEGPHLLVDADALARIRAAAAIPGSHHGQALAANRDWCDRLGEGIIKGRDRSTGNWAYDRSYLAVKAAAVHAVTGDPAYAGLALRALEAITADPDPEKRTMEDGTGLSRATVTVGYALAWDLAAPAWPADRRARILATMQAAAVTWDGAGHPNIAGDYHSNWTSVMRGGEILLRLALGETESPRMALITGELLKHVRSHGSAGWSQEGPIYLGYSMAFGAPAAVALERAGKPAVAEAMRAKAFWRLPMHTGTFSAGQFAPSWGVGGPYFDERGWLGLQAQLVPAADLPGYLWFYDRYRGVANPAPAKDKFDHRGWGQALALLGYPAGVQPADPTATAAGVLTDDHGGAFWRPRWRDAGDPVVGLVADAHAAARAWDNLDAGNLILIAHGSVFAAAAGNASHDRLGDDVSRMVFGGRSNPDTTLTGRLLYAEGDATGMRAGIDYSAAVRGTGPTSVTRHIGTVAVGDDVAMLVVDAWDMRGSRPVAWTLNQMDGIAAIEPLSDGGRPGFLVRGQQGGWLAGWLVGPAAAELVPRDPLRLTWTATDGGAAVVAMVMGSGPRPVPRSIGDGIGGEVQVAGASLRWDAKAGRVIATRLPGPHADFSISATTGTAPLTVRVAAAQGLDQVRWSVDGKAVAAGAGAEITLADGGAPRIRLDSAQGAAEIQVQVANRPPVPRIAADRTFGPAPLAVRLDASGSSDPDGHPLAFSWQLPGGERVEGPVLARTFDGRDAVVEVALTVSDGHGGRSGTVQRILVGNQAPAVAATVTPRRGPPPLAVRLDAGASRDPEGGALTASWLLPDGTTAQGLEVPATITIPGLHRIRCTVRDTAGATASQEVLVEVADQPPVIRIGPDLPAVDPKVLAKDPAEQSRRRWGVDVGKDGLGPIVQPLRAAPLQMRLAAAASDPEGGPVTIAWDFADGTTGSGAAVEHTWRNPGHYRITATARDAQGQAATAAMTVEVDDPAGRVPDGPATTVPGLFWEHAYNNRPHIWRNGRPTSVPADAPRPPPGGASGGGVVPPAADPADAHDAILSFLTLDRAQRGVIAMPIPERTSSRSFRWVTAYTGYLEAPADGAYDFELPCFAAGQLWIGGRLVCFRPELRYNNGDCRAPGRITLRKGLHSVRIMHAWNAFIGTKPELQPMLEPRWRTPGAAVMAAIPAAAWQRPTSMPELVLDLHPGTVRPGERLTASVLRSRAGAQAALATATWDFGDGSTATGLEAGHAYDRPGEYRMTVRLRNDRGAEDVLTRSILVGERMPAISAGRLAPGLDYRYYKSDDSFNRMPDFASWRPTAAGVVAEPDITSADQPDFFAFQFEGYLHVPSGGVHRFKLDCDDGGILRLDGKVVVDNSIITPEIQNATGDVGLDAGLHRLQIDYFEGIIAQRINLLVQEPGETDWKPVPRSWYWRDDGDGIDHRPLVSATIPARAPAGTPVRLDAGASSDPDGDPVTVTWDLGDGRILEGAVVEALWRNPGTYPVTATVRAHRGEAVGTAARITVAASSNRPPTVRIDAPVVTGDRALPFTASAVTADPDGDPVVCTWDFGDGARAVGATAARLLGGGRWLVTVTAEDGRGGIAYATAMVGIAMPKERMIGAYLTNVRGRGRLTGPSSVAGYLPQAGWNAINEKGPTPLTDAAGGSSGAVIRLLGVATRRSDEFTWTGGTSGEVGLHGTIGLPSRKESPDGATVVEGIPFARYDVLVGLAGLPTNSKRPVTIQVNDAVRVLYPLDGWKDAYVLSRATDAKDASPGTNVAEFTGVTGATLRITGPFSWFQIVERP